MDKYSTEYFFPIQKYSYGIPLKCHNNSFADGKIDVYENFVSLYHIFKFIIQFYLLICNSLKFLE